MFTLLTILTLIAPILAAGFVYGLTRQLLSHWDTHVEAPTFAGLDHASTTARMDAARSPRGRARQVA